MRSKARKRAWKFRRRAPPTAARSTAAGSVDAAHPKTVAVEFGVEVDDLPQRVHSGIGPPGHRGQQSHACEALDRVLEVVLHGIAMGLRLPAGVGRAVIVEADGDAVHRQETVS
jgi:hypothetical protein